MSNFKYGASCTEVMYKKLEHPTDNLKDTRLFICRQAKNRQAKNKILFHACGSRRGSRRGAARGSRLNAVSPASTENRRALCDCNNFVDFQRIFRELHRKICQENASTTQNPEFCRRN